MTWQPGSKRWVKKVPAQLQSAVGKTLVAVSCRQLGTKSTKEASLAAANDWWKSFLSHHAPKEPPRRPYWEQRRDDMARWYRCQNDEDAAKLVEQQSLDELRKQFVEELGEKIAAHQLGLSISDEASIWSDRISTLSKKVQGERALSRHLQEFLDHKKVSVSLGRWDNLRSHLRRFETFVGHDQAIDELTSATLVGFFDHLKATDTLNDYAKRDTFTTAKQFIRHLVELDLIAAPGKLTSRSLSFVVEQADIVVFSTDELKKIYDKAVDRTKLFLLLAMNCGFTQVDISDLKQAQVDFKNGTITRKRSKTKRHKKAPVVTYKLWKETHRLLKHFASEYEERVLTTEDGKPLMQDSVDGDKRSKSDNIRSCFVRALDALQIPQDQRKGFSAIRATSASLLENHPEFSRYAQHFLARAPHSVADRHYVVPSQQRFDDALDWLRQQYGIE
jgi:integrase